MAGALAIAFSYAMVLAMEFVLMRVGSRQAGAGAAGWRSLSRAWLGEVLAAPRVFFWRQPFFSDAAPDFVPDNAAVKGLRGVVFIHGIVCNRGFWTPWLLRLREQGRPFVAVSLEPVFGSIDGYAPQIDAAVRRLAQSTGMAPVLVCHSMGGLVARAWLRACDADSRVHHVLTLGTPHRGTWLAHLGQSTSARQMRPDSGWLQLLERAESPARRALFSCWYSDFDNIVFPAANARLEGAQNRLVSGLAHVQMAFDEGVVRDCLARIGQQDRKESSQCP
ncbi:MAG: alpha/beta fold hydrolase [Burkholderiaceae bacterium]|nr:alpha/beta fold hydrolase [Burkholderiaceae bacterium]